MRAFAEAHFGSDEVLGVWFCGEDGARYTLDEADELYACLGDECPPMFSLFPDGTSAITCTNYAVQVGRKLPDRTEIFGFANEHNPTSRVAREEIHPGGHDFALVDGRYLVDPWIRLVAAACDQICFDLGDPADAELVRDLYGPRECWRRMTSAEADFLPARRGNGASAPMAASPASFACPDF
ncbi:hypothetical protein [Burkholderia pseudomallei]|uniref:hypothetical protein n=1 Tax=Burkholderia pseudomallei TaxID=28450 RepID=UPI000A1A0450|nr:hypothetical protein [Burkholderia pseudomallei]ARL04218.1 hypothetical protein BOC44_20790 [Burkholderia pseudomallei]